MYRDHDPILSELEQFLLADAGQSMQTSVEDGKFVVRICWRRYPGSIFWEWGEGRGRTMREATIAAWTASKNETTFPREKLT